MTEGRLTPSGYFVKVHFCFLTGRLISRVVCILRITKNENEEIKLKTLVLKLDQTELFIARSKRKASSHFINGLLKKTFLSLCDGDYLVPQSFFSRRKR